MDAAWMMSQIGLLCGAFSLLCGLDEQKKGLIMFKSYTSLILKFHFPPKAHFYNSWARNDAEQTAS